MVVQTATREDSEGPVRGGLLFGEETSRQLGVGVVEGNVHWTVHDARIA